MITRELAGQLYGFGYQILDNITGKSYKVEKARGSDLICRKEDGTVSYVEFSDIGKDYFVLCRPYSHLTKEIEPGVVPIVECAKIAFPEKNWRLPLGNHFYPMARTQYPQIYCDFSFVNGDFKCINDSLTFEKHVSCVPNQPALFNYLMRLHFPINLPDGTWKEITI